MRIVETMQKADWPAIISRVLGAALLLAGVFLAAGLCAATPQDDSVPAFSIRIRRQRIRSAISLFFVLSVTGLIFLVVFSLLSYASSSSAARPADAEHEPAQVYGSTQIELAWTDHSHSHRCRAFSRDGESHPRNPGRAQACRGR